MRSDSFWSAFWSAAIHRRFSPNGPSCGRSSPRRRKAAMNRRTPKMATLHARSRALSAAGGSRPVLQHGSAVAIFNSLLLAHMAVTPVHGCPACLPHGRRSVNGPDPPIVSSPLEPGVNAGSNTACGGKGRERPSRFSTANRCRRGILPRCSEDSAFSLAGMKRQAAASTVSTSWRTP
jgi:hypothetical protein